MRSVFRSKYFHVKIVVVSLGSDRYGSRRQSRTSSNISKEGEKCQDYKAVKRKNRSKSFGAVFSEIDSTIQKNVKYYYYYINYSFSCIKSTQMLIPNLTNIFLVLYL